MKINIIVSDKQYGEALALTLARCLGAVVTIDGGEAADFVLCDEPPAETENRVEAGKEKGTVFLAVSKFEPVSRVIDRIRAQALGSGADTLPNIRAIAVTGLGEEFLFQSGGACKSKVESIGEMLAQLVSSLYGKRALQLDFSSVGGPPDSFVYQALAKGIVNPELLSFRKNPDPCKAEAGRGPVLNPLRRLSGSEAASLLRLAGTSDAFDLIVLTVPLASPHWELCVKAAERTICVGNAEEGEIVGKLYENVTKGLGGLLFLEPEEGDKDIYSETGARLKGLLPELLEDEV